MTALSHTHKILRLRTC